MLPWLPAYSHMMPVLQARESLTRILEHAIGSGSLKKGTSRRTINDLRQQAEQRGARAVHKPRSQEEHHAMLTSIGIQIVGGLAGG